MAYKPTYNWGGPILYGFNSFNASFGHPLWHSLNMFWPEKDMGILVCSQTFSLNIGNILQKL